MIKRPLQQIDLTERQKRREQNKQRRRERRPKIVNRLAELAGRMLGGFAGPWKYLLIALAVGCIVFILVNSLL